MHSNPGSVHTFTAFDCRNAQLDAQLGSESPGLVYICAAFVDHNAQLVTQVGGEGRERGREIAKPIVQEVEDSMKRGWAEIKDAVKSVTDPSG